MSQVIFTSNLGLYLNMGGENPSVNGTLIAKEDKGYCID